MAITPGSSGLQAPSRVLLNQIRTIDRCRLDRYAGRLSPEELARVDDAIKVSLGLIPL
ncbi:hypothetical protein LBMAG21_17380 [Armatimonadota bacterium]|nr:hypothetical protein LBMAG21_17380 [Armatimonadota bacterium]